MRTPLDQQEDEWNATLNTNLRGTWLMSKAVAKRLVAAKRGGSIINISSIAGLERSMLPGAMAYGVSKAAVIHLSKVQLPSISHLFHDADFALTMWVFAAGDGYGAREV